MGGPTMQVPRREMVQMLARSSHVVAAVLWSFLMVGRPGWQAGHWRRASLQYLQKGTAYLHCQRGCLRPTVSDGPCCLKGLLLWPWAPRSPNQKGNGLTKQCMR